MVNAKPPQERATANFDSNPTQRIDVVQLLHVAERALRREALLREMAIAIEQETANAGKGIICCVGGRAVREIPCRNRDYWACLYRNRGREFV
jgi:hypothetical protein